MSQESAPSDPLNPIPFTPDARERLRQNFLNHDPSTHPSRWETLWARNDLPWDQGKPNPALSDWLSAPSPLRSPPVDEKTGKRLRALVPGCGRGYDVLLFAAHGYDAYGVEGAETAVKSAREGMEGWEKRAEYAGKDGGVGVGTARFVLGDWFADGWWEELEKEEGRGGEMRGFDLIYDYTFLCALPPPLRPKWAARMAQLLAPNGRLVCLEFPTYKPVSAGGPPWAVRPAYYIAYLSKPGEEVQFTEDGEVVGGVDEENPERSGRGLVRAAHWQPERTHEIGKGTDWISIWKHQGA